jgi:hypothetical protein
MAAGSAITSLQSSNTITPISSTSRVELLDSRPMDLQSLIETIAAFN